MSKAFEDTMFEKKITENAMIHFVSHFVYTFVTHDKANNHI